MTKINATPTQFDKWHRLMAIKGQMEVLEAEAKRLKADLVADMDEAGADTIVDPSRDKDLIRQSLVATTTIDREILKEEFPQAWGAATRQTTYVRITVCK